MWAEKEAKPHSLDYVEALITSERRLKPKLLDNLASVTSFFPITHQKKQVVWTGQEALVILLQCRVFLQLCLFLTVGHRTSLLWALYFHLYIGKKMFRVITEAASDSMIAWMARQRAGKGICFCSGH